MTEYSLEQIKTAQTTVPSFLVVIPVYNHAGTLRQVVKRVLEQHQHVLVIDDGSTDMIPVDILPVYKTDYPEPLQAEGHPLNGLPVRYLRHTENRGKGAAILTAATEARTAGFSHIITLDADGQHDPAELGIFFEACIKNPLSIVIGVRNFNTINVPGASRFGRAFSNFWFKVQTGSKTQDSQSGFRAYPLMILENIKCSEAHYSFEIEIIVRAAWAGFTVKDVPITVFYPQKEKRVSHFRPLLDNVRIALLNTRLTIRSIMPIPHKKYLQDTEGRITILHPLRSLQQMLSQNETPGNLSLSAALGIVLGTLPLIGLHSISIILAAGSLRLNKIMGLAASQLCIPPFVPALCIEAGYYLRNGHFLTEISMQTLGYEALERFIDWLLGSLVLAPFFATAIGLLIFLLSKGLQKGMLHFKKESACNKQQSGKFKNWSSRSLGSRFQHAFLYRLLAIGSWQLGYLALFFIVSWYWLRPSIRARSKPYLQRRFPAAGKLNLAKHQWILQWNFGKVLIDRAAAGILGTFHTEASEKDMQTLRDLHAEKKGIILITAHAGAWQTAMFALQKIIDVPINIIMHRDALDNDKQYFEHRTDMPAFAIIDPNDGPAAGIAMAQALQRGEIVGIMGDRPFGGQRHTIQAPFLGGNIPLPWSGYYLASVTGAPIIISFAPRTGPCRACHYIADILRVMPNSAKTAETYRTYLQSYTQALENFVDQTPYQFFNFYNMWENNG